MIPVNNSNEVKDNTIVINGVEFKVSDGVATQILKLAKNGIGEDVEWTVKEMTDIVSKKKYFCIFNSCHGATKPVANNAIKALNGITTIKVAGKKGTYDAWGYQTEKAANEKLASLPAHVEA